MTDSIIFGAGCFWCIQSVIDKKDGVLSSFVGYSGGHKEHPTYGQVCCGKTGHIEVIKVNYDSNIVNFMEICEIFFSIHDYTESVKEQYKSVIFYQTEEQKGIVIKMINELKRENNVQTELRPTSIFYMAEENHQKYAEKKYGKNYNR